MLCIYNISAIQNSLFDYNLTISDFKIIIFSTISIIGKSKK